MALNNFTNQKEEASCGEYLKKIREGRGISLEKASQETKILRHLLEAIENDDYKKLPPPAFLKGIIRKYSSYLRLDENKILDFYKKCNGRKISSGENDLLPENRFIVFRPKIVFFFSSLAPKVLKFSLFLIIIIYLFFKITQFLLPAKIALYYPPEDLTVISENLVIEGRVIRGKALYFRDKEVLLDGKGVFREEIILNPGLNLLEFKALNSLGLETKIQRNIIFSTPS